MTNTILNNESNAGSFLDYIRFAFEQSPKTLEEVTRELGYTSPNIVKLMLQGITKVPLDRIPRLANALNVDASLLMRLALEDYSPQVLAALEETFELLTTPNEREWVRVVRHISGDTDPRMTREIRELLEEHFQNNVVTRG